MGLIFNLIVCFYTSFLINSVLRAYWLPSVYEQYASQNITGKEYEIFTSEEILASTI
jgi:hypothetical protein